MLMVAIILAAGLILWFAYTNYWTIEYTEPKRVVVNKNTEQFLYDILSEEQKSCRDELKRPAMPYNVYPEYIKMSTDPYVTLPNPLNGYRTDVLLHMACGCDMELYKERINMLNNYNPYEECQYFKIEGDICLVDKRRDYVQPTKGLLVGHFFDNEEVNNPYKVDEDFISIEGV